MATKLIALGTILLIGIAARGCSAQFWGQQYPYNRRYPQNGYSFYPPQQQQLQQQQQQQQRNNFPQYDGYNNQQAGPFQFQLPPGVSLANAEWVCKNPKTNDMMVIASEEGPAANNNGGQNQGQWQNNYPTQPPFPQLTPTQPPYPQVNPTQPTQPSYPPQTEAPNNNGDGLIDIRSGK